MLVIVMPGNTTSENFTVFNTNRDNKTIQNMINILKKTFIIFSTAFLFLLMTSPLGSAASKINMNVHLNQPIYEPSDEMIVRIKIKPKVDVSDVRVALKIGEEDHYVFARTHFLGNIKKDKEQEVEFTKNNAKSFGLELGKNPFLVEVTEKQKTISRFSTDLGLKETTHENKMRLALAVSLADKPHLDLDKNIKNRIVQKRILPVLEKYNVLSNKHRGLINYIFSPILAETISKISSEYTLIEKNGPKTIPPSSHSSLRAKRIKNSFNKLFNSKTSGLIFTTYTQARSKELSPKDLDDQFKEGRKILGSVFSQPRFATYPPQGQFYKGQPKDKNGLWLSKNTAKPVANIKTTLPLLKSKNRKASTIRALAHIVEKYNDSNTDLVIVTTDMARPDNIAHFLNLAKKQKWLRLAPLRSLKTSSKKSAAESDPYIRKIPKLKEARRTYVLLGEALASENIAFDQAKMAIYLAEDKNTDEKTARELASKASTLLKKEIEAIILKLSPLTLTGSQGKLPIKIINNSNSKYKLLLEIKTDRLDIKNKMKTIEIGPKENLVSIPVKVLQGGKHRVLVQLRTKSGIISKQYLVVSTSLPTSFWYYFASVFAVLLLIILGAFYARARRN